MKNVVLCVLLGFGVYATHAQNLINGFVTNNENEPLIGATILLKPGNHETVSNGKGEFVIAGLKEDTYKLKITYLGYETFEKSITVKQRVTINAVLNKHTFQTKEIIVSSTRATAETPTSQSTINIDEIKRREAGQDIPYLLQLTPSVVTTSDAGTGIGYTNFRIRGTDLNRINVTVNDIPLNDAESHGVFFVNMPDFIESTNSIQIQRGVGTSSNGAAAFGASVNMQTNQIELLPFAEINNAIGSFNTMKNTVKAGTGLIDGRFAFDARLSRIKSDGFIDRSTSNLKSFFVSGTYRGEKDVVRVNIFSGLEKTYQAWEGIPKSRLDGDRDAMLLFASLSGYSAEETENLLNSNNRTFNRFLFENQTDNYQQDHYHVFYTRTVNENLSANIAYHQTNGFGYYESYRYNKKLIDYGADTILSGTDTITRSDLINRKYLDNTFIGGIGSINYTRNRLKLIVGGGINRYEGKHYGEVLWSAQNAKSFIPNQRYYENKGIKDDANMYVRANIKTTEKLFAYIDVQYRHINYKIEGFDDDQRDLSQTHSYNFINPKLGVFLNLNKNANIYFNNAIGNREPSRTTLIDANPEKPTPKPEQLYNSELGGEYKTEKWSIKANGYIMYYTNQLVLTGNINDVGSAILENVDKSYRAGVELSWAVRPYNWVTWQGNLTLSQNKIQNFTSYTDNWDTWGQEIEELGTTNISFSPEVIASSNFQFTVLKNLNMDFITQYVGEQYIDNTSSKDRKLDDYLVNNLRINYNLKTDWLKEAAIYVQVNNLFDVEYISNAWIYPFYTGGEINYLDGYFLQAGANFMIGLNLTF